MQLQTKVKIPVPNFEITHQDKLMSIGSCFAHNMAQRFDSCKFNIIDNPFGILYNPLSIAKGLEEILSKKAYTDEDLFFHNERWNSFNHHSQFSKSKPSETLELINQSIDKAHLQLLNSKVLIITLGTANVFFQKVNNQFVANCHKIPNHQFEKKLISVEEIVNALEHIFIKIQDANPNIQIILTLSPIRHIRDGLSENQRSKATLLVAIHQLMEKLKDLYYFPSYEIALDELRDYRFYKEDMIHPSKVAIDYIWKAFVECYFDERTKQVIPQIRKLIQAKNHKVENPNSAEYQLFIKNQIKKIEELQQQYKWLNFEEELNQWKMDN